VPLGYFAEIHFLSPLRSIVALEVKLVVNVVLSEMPIFFLFQN